MLRIAAVSGDETNRLLLARAFDLAPASWRVTLHEEIPPDADIVVCAPDRDVQDAIAFDPAHPERVIADITARAGRVAGRCTFVLGAAGGCGATSVALHLAAIAGGCLVEASGGDVRRRLAMDSARSWAESLGTEPLEVSALPVAPGFRVLLSPHGVALEQVAAVAERSASLFEHVFIDGDRSLLDAEPKVASVGVLVMPPTRPAALRARSLLDGYPSIRWAIVTNRLGPGGALRRREIESLLERRVAVELPCSAALRDAEDEGRVLTSAISPWLWQLRRLWQALATA